MYTFKLGISPLRIYQRNLYRSFSYTKIQWQFQNDQLFQSLKTIIKSTDQSVKSNPSLRSNSILRLFQDSNINSIMDPRYQKLMKDVRADPEIPNDLLWDLSRIFELYIQNTQHGDNFQFENIDYSKGGSKNSGGTKRVFGKELNKRQLVIGYFISMCSMVIGVTMYGVDNLNVGELGLLCGVVLWVSVTFNPFF